MDKTSAITMSRFHKFIKSKAVQNVLPYFALALILFVFGLTVDQWEVYMAERKRVATVFKVIAAILGAGYFPLSVLTIKKKIRVRVLIWYTMFVGLFIRLVYICYTSVYDRQYDVWYIYDEGDKKNFYLHHGHMQYIYDLFCGAGLPDSNTYQFYHPPLWHMGSAFVMRVFTLLGFDRDYSLECIQLLSVFCSQAIIILFYKILKEMKVRQTIVAPIMVFAAFCPILIVMGGTINNDVMMWMFFMATLLYLVRWWQRGKFADIIKMAICLGLGMMTKISCVMLAPIIAIAFVFRFLQSFSRSRKTWALEENCSQHLTMTCWQYIKQFACFGLASIPLGMWYPIRNLILFEQPLNYVMRFKKSSELFCGNIRFLRRVFSFPLEELSGKLFCTSTEDYSMLPYLIKSSVFEEHGYDSVEWVGWVLFYAALFLAIVSFVCMCVLVCKSFAGRFKQPQTDSQLILAFTWIVLVFGYLSFCLKYPFTCTMDARYIMPAILISMVFTMMAVQSLHKKNRRLGKIMHAVVWVAVLVYAVATVIFYVNVR